MCALLTSLSQPPAAAWRGRGSVGLQAVSGRRGCRPRRDALPTVALFGPSKQEAELKSRLDATSQVLEEALRKGAETALALETERGARKTVEGERDMYKQRLAEAEKDVFKLERLVAETEKKLASYQTSAETQIARLADALKKAGGQL
jgi:hypothetical protein